MLYIFDNTNIKRYKIYYGLTFGWFYPPKIKNKKIINFKYKIQNKIQNKKSKTHFTYFQVCEGLP